MCVDRARVFGYDRDDVDTLFRQRDRQIAIDVVEDERALREWARESDQRSNDIVLIFGLSGLVCHGTIGNGIGCIRQSPEFWIDLS